MLKNQINQISRIRNELFQISIKSENPFWDKVLKFLNYINKLDPEDLELIELHISFFGGKKWSEAPLKCKAGLSPFGRTFKIVEEVGTPSIL